MYQNLQHIGPQKTLNHQHSEGKGNPEVLKSSKHSKVLHIKKKAQLSNYICYEIVQSCDGVWRLDDIRQVDQKSKFYINTVRKGSS